MKRWTWILLPLALGTFLLGLGRLFQMRFAHGDIYPAYSSLRADPLGTKALFESLRRLLPAQRHFHSTDRLGPGRHTTLFHLGSEPLDLVLPVDEVRHLESFVAEGGRLVLSLRAPSSGLFSPPATGSSTNRSGGGRPTPKPNRSPADRDEFISLWERWGLSYDQTKLAKDVFGGFRPASASRVAPGESLPEELPCHTPLHFEEPADNWRVIYSRLGAGPVLVERDLGDGTIVFAADTFFLSNEGLLWERHPALLAWLVGASRRVLFDETHLGVSEQPGIATLSRKYRLHGFLLGLLLLAGLFVWKNSLSFLPPTRPAETEAQSLIKGRESSAGVVNLLRRNLPPSELLTICLTEWKKSCGPRVPAAQLQQIQLILNEQNSLPPKDRNPVDTYRRISRVLTRRR